MAQPNNQMKTRLLSGAACIIIGIALFAFLLYRKRLGIHVDELVLISLIYIQLTVFVLGVGVIAWSLLHRIQIPEFPEIPEIRKHRMIKRMIGLGLLLFGFLGFVVLTSYGDLGTMVLMFLTLPIYPSVGLGLIFSSLPPVVDKKLTHQITAEQ